MSDEIDPSEATISDDFDPHMGQLLTVEARGESYSLKRFGGKVVVVVGYHPDWVIEAVERSDEVDVTKTTEDDVKRAQRAALGIDDDG